MPYRLAIFDFDGTLADSFPFFAATFNDLAQQHGFRPITPDEVPAMRHRSPREIMAQVGLPAWKLAVVARDFIGRMRDNHAGIPLFDGIGTALATLAARGVQLAIVSSNAEDNVRRILGAEINAQFATYECGMSIFGKPLRLRKVLRQLQVAAADAVYVGDQSTDLLAARGAGIAFAAVPWGYGTIESMREHQPEIELASVADIARLAPPPGA